MINNIKEQLRRDEGFRAKVYQCSEGFNTIGIGRNLDTHPLTQCEANYLGGIKGIAPEAVEATLVVMGITEEQAEWLLDHQITETIGRLLAKYGWMQEMSEERFGVCINMTYQMGFRGFKKFKHFIKSLEIGCYATASDEMKNSKWYKQTPERAERLCKQMLENRWV